MLGERLFLSQLFAGVGCKGIFDVVDTDWKEMRFALCF